MLPFVLLGWAKDFWEPFEWYLKVEADLPATYFLIPFKGRPGERTFASQARRATKYDVSDLNGWPAKLTGAGCELGVHGIDAWHSVDQARVAHRDYYEIDRVERLEQRLEIAGVRPCARCEVRLVEMSGQICGLCREQIHKAKMMQGVMSWLMVSFLIWHVGHVVFEWSSLKWFCAAFALGVGACALGIRLLWRLEYWLQAQRE